MLHEAGLGLDEPIGLMESYVPHMPHIQHLHLIPLIRSRG